MSRTRAILALAFLTALVAIAALLSPRTPQPLSYHHFADQRGWLGITNFGDVASNLAFAVFGIWGLVWLARLTPEEAFQRFLDHRERWFYIAVFFGMLLTAVGSAYYHLSPDNDRLVWDRLPMTIVFMSLVAAMIAERISVRAALWLWPVLLAVGALSVLEWHWSEQAGRGDLRFYAAVQIYAVLVLLLVLFLPPRYTRSSDFGVVVGLYVLAKLLETFDKQVFALGHVVSGHTLKHIVAALAGLWILRILENRERLEAPDEPRVGAIR
jgi:hypothetical protein